MGNLILMHLNGFSYELISILKTISHFIFVQIPFLISIPIASLLLDITYDKLVLLLISFLIGSLILSCLGSISASMNLLNNRNYLLGSVIVIIFSVPAVIFSVGLINSNESYDSLINILFGILLIVFAINPWASGACLKLALQNN
jgi:ABC-type transport system involved in cytochrome c biogenesis, permease component